MESISHLREGLTLICFESYHDIPYSHRQSRKNITKTFLMFNTLPQFVRYHLTINICCLLIFIISCKEKKGNPVFIFSKQRIFWHWTHNFSANKLTKKYLLVKWTAKCFFIVIAIKQLFQWVGIQLEFAGTNLMFWSFKKDFLRNVALDFMLLVWKWRLASLTPSKLLPLESFLIPTSLALGIKLIMCQLLSLVLCDFGSFFEKPEMLPQ